MLGDEGLKKQSTMSKRVKRILAKVFLSQIIPFISVCACYVEYSDHLIKGYLVGNVVVLFLLCLDWSLNQLT